jgi:O-antigen ligase
MTLAARKSREPYNAAALLGVFAAVLSMTGFTSILGFDLHYVVLVLPAIGFIWLITRPPELIGSRRVPPLIVAFVLLCALSYMWSADKLSTKNKVVDLVTGTFLMWVAGAFADRRQLCRAWAVIGKVVFVLTFIIVLGTHDTLVPNSSDNAVGWHGPFDHKNGLGFYAVLTLLALWFEHDDWRKNRWWLVAGGALLLLSQSRSALAVLLIGCAFGLWESKYAAEQVQSRRSAFAALSIVLAVSGTALLVFNVPIIAGILGKDPTLTGRTDIWKQVWKAIQTNPIHGFGYGGMWTIRSAPTQPIWRALGFQAAHGHDGFLDVALQLGVIGFVLLMTFFGTTIVRALQGRVRGNRIDLWVCIVLITLLASSIGESPPLLGIGWLVAVMLATTMAQRPEPVLGRLPASVRRRPLGVPRTA